MAVLTQVAAGDVCGGFSTGKYAVMTANAIINNRAVIQRRV